MADLAPWSCEWDTRNYVNGPHSLRVIAYNAAGREIASDTITVIVSNPSPPPVDSPPPPSVEPSPQPQPTIPTAPGGTPAPQDPAVRFSRRRAGDAVKKILSRRYGRAFRNRRGYQLACVRASETRWSCAVRWRYGGLVYKGKVKLSLRPDGRIASQTVLRRLFR